MKPDQASSISGLVLVDKPVGITSFDVVRKLRKQLNTKKIGHSGTLDPFASGLLVVAAGNATKALAHLLKHNKSYRVKIIFGVTSDTFDPEGTVTESGNALELTGKAVSDALRQFTGTYLQLPPRFSAKKIDGKRACDRVRLGETVELKPVEVSCSALELIEFGSEKSGRFEGYPSAEIVMTVGSGFYVRSFARDLGIFLKVGALAASLRRETIGQFSVAQAKLLGEITVKDVFPLSPADFNLPSLSLTDSEWHEIRHGRQIQTDTLSEGEVVMFYQGKWAGFAEVKRGILNPKRVISNETN